MKTSLALALTLCLLGFAICEDFGRPEDVRPGPKPPQPGPHPGPHPGPGPQPFPPGPPGPHPGPPGPRPGPPGPGPRPGPPPVCGPDFMRFCAFRVPDMNNMEDIVECFESHLQDLNLLCQDLIKNATATIAKFHAACDTDLANVCPEAIGNTDKTRQCVIENLTKLSSGCLQTISDIAKDMKKPGPPHLGPPPRFGGMLFDDFESLGSMVMRQETGMQYRFEEEDNEYHFDDQEYGDRQGRGMMGPAMAASAAASGALFTIGIVLLVKTIMMKRKMRENSNKMPLGAPLMTDSEDASKEWC